jgi:hypothetical protein
MQPSRCHSLFLRLTRRYFEDQEADDSELFLAGDIGTNMHAMNGHK